MPSDITVRFVYVEDRAALNSVSIRNGQIIALTEEAGYYYDMNDTRYLVSQTNGDAAAIPFGVTDSVVTALNQRVTATVPSIDELADGKCVYLVNVISATTAAFSLNVSSTGDKPVYLTDGTRATTQFKKNTGAFFVYNTARDAGGCWDMILDPKQINGHFGQGYGECTTASATSAKTATIFEYALLDGGVVAIKFSNAVTGPATLNINSSGAYPIVYQGNPLLGYEIPASSTAVFMYQSGNYILLGVDNLIEVVNTLTAALEYKDIYWCTYGVTTFQEIVDARDNEKLVALVYDQVVYILSQSLSGSVKFAPLMYRANVQILTCKVTDEWLTTDLILATKEQLDEKYTLPVDGIPKTDLAFTPAEVDPTFEVADDAPESVLTGRRFTQLEQIERNTTFNQIYIALSGTDFHEVPIDGDTGEEDDRTTLNEWSLQVKPLSTNIFVTLGDPTYEWCVWAYSSPASLDPTHPSNIPGYVAGTIPHYLEYKQGDVSFSIGIRRVDDAQFDDTELAYIAQLITVRCVSDAVSDTSGGCCVIQNNSMLVDQFVAIAETYYNGRADIRPDTTLNMEYGTPTILDTSADTNKIDSATLVGLVLRGIPYGKSSYYSYYWIAPSEWVANTDFTWALDPAYYSTQAHSYDLQSSTVRYAAQLAELYVRWGRVIPIDDKLVNLKPGDLIFYATKDSRGAWNAPSEFMHIDHVAICTEAELTNSLTPDWDYTVFPYRHTLIHATDGAAPVNGQPVCIEHAIVEKGYSSPADYTTPNYHTICLICRPDLGTQMPLVNKLSKLLPSNPLSSGVPGQMMYDDSTLYICVSANTWKSVSLS